MKPRFKLPLLMLAFALGWLLPQCGHAFYNPSAAGADHDGNGNVAALVSAAGGTTPACYEHGPFGKVLRATGPMARANPFRFSAKYQNDETDLVYYGYRYYNASTGRWLSRDPLTDRSFLDRLIHKALDRKIKQLEAEALMPPYGFVRNDPIRRFDKDGLVVSTDPKDYPDFDPHHPEKPSKKKVCVLKNAIRPGTILNPGCGQCWRCVYECKPPGAGGGQFITRYQIGGCLSLTGYVPGWVRKSDCESADSTEPLPVEGIPPDE